MGMERLAQAAYRPLWLAARRRVEVNGLSLEGTPLVLKGLSVDEADAIAGLLGIRRPPPGSAVRVSLAALDRQLRASSVGRPLVEVLSAVSGPLIDRRAERAASEAGRAGQWDQLHAHSAVTADERLTGWLDHVRTRGMDRRLARHEGPTAMATALDVLAVLQGDDQSRRLNVLAAEVTGDSHGLDRGQPAGTLTVHALSWLAGLGFPQDAADWRRTWSEAGVACDDLSCDVLVLNLPGWPAEPLRLTLRQVMAWRPPRVPTSDVFACENPAVVAAAADHPGDRPLVCVDGMPSTAALSVLDRLASEGHRIRYHGDFDWRGLGIATVVARKLPTAVAWRYGAVDYEQALIDGLGTVELAGRSSPSPWDKKLAPTMEAAGIAIYEEQVLSSLLCDLRT